MFPCLRVGKFYLLFARIFSAMADDEWLPAKYQKAEKWSLRKLESHFEAEKKHMVIVKSNIKRLEKNQREHLQRVDGLVSNINEPDEVAAYIADVKEKSTLVELSVLDRQILSTAKEHSDELERLYEIERVSAYLLNLIKRKSL